MQWRDLITQMGIFRAMKTYLNYILRSCMDDNSNYSYSCMTSSSLIRATHAWLCHLPVINKSCFVFLCPNNIGHKVGIGCTSGLRSLLCYDSHGHGLFSSFLLTPTPLLTHHSHTYSTSDLLFSHLFHSWPIVLTLTPPWLIYPCCTFTIYTARYPPVTLAWSYSNIPEF